MLGFPFLNLMNDLWTSNSVACVLGSSISIIEKKLRKGNFALAARKHILGHSAVIVGTTIKETFESDQPEVEISKKYLDSC